MSDYLYGVSYEPTPVCCPKPECKNTILYELTETQHFLCIECGHQFPVESNVE